MTALPEVTIKVQGSQRSVKRFVDSCIQIADSAGVIISRIPDENSPIWSLLRRDAVQTLLNNGIWTVGDLLLCTESQIMKLFERQELGFTGAYAISKINEAGFRFAEESESSCLA